MSSVVTLAAVGDIALGDHLLTFGQGTRSLLERRGAPYPFDAVIGLLAGADLRFGNLETVLSDAGRNDADVYSCVMRGPPSAVQSLAQAGFSVLSVANNHAAHFGLEAFEDTVARLADADIDAVGKSSLPAGGCRPVVREANGAAVGFLAYSFVPERHYTGRQPYAGGEVGAVRRDIEALRPQVDYLVISCHWGLELVDRPSRNTIELARSLVDWGADVVLGHHPHVFQAVESYRGKLICYSLGNFVFDAIWTKECRRSAVLRVSLTRNGGVVRAAWKAMPVWIADDYRPLPAAPGTAADFHKNLARISKREYYDVYAHDPEGQAQRYYATAARLEQKAQREKAVFVLRRLWRLNRHTLRALCFDKLIDRLLPAKKNTALHQEGP